MDKGERGLKNWAVFMDAICISSLTCFQSTNATCTDLILTNKGLFKNSNVLEAGIPDHHNFITKALRCQLLKGREKIKMY